MQNNSNENDFDLHENETACRTHFHKKNSEMASLFDDIVSLASPSIASSSPILRI